MSEITKINDDPLEKVAGGDQKEADAYLAEVMKYYGVSTKEEAFAKMTEEQKHYYQIILKNPVWDENPGTLDH